MRQYLAYQPIAVGPKPVRPGGTDRDLGTDRASHGRQPLLRPFEAALERKLVNRADERDVGVSDLQQPRRLVGARCQGFFDQHVDAAREQALCDLDMRTACAAHVRHVG